MPSRVKRLRKVILPMYTFECKATACMNKEIEWMMDATQRHSLDGGPKLGRQRLHRVVLTHPLQNPDEAGV